MFNMADEITMKDKMCRGEEYVDEQKCSDELPFTSDNMFINKDDSKKIDGIKVEKTYFVNIKNEIDLKKVEDQGDVGDKDNNIVFVGIKTEVGLEPENFQKTDHQFNVSNFKIKREEVDDQVDVIEMKSSYCQEGVCKSEFKEENFNSLQDWDNLPQTDSNLNLPEMQECSLAQPHSTLPEVILVEPASERKDNQLINENSSKIFRCEHCPFETKYKHNVQNHLLTHKSPSEITMYRCEQCSYETKYKYKLKLHLVVHKDPSEITMYQCEFCSYQAKYKHPLKRHLLIHRNPSEVPMYQCEHCSFQTKYKNHVIKHLLIHKSPSEITMYQCEQCPFQTKRKHNLTSHLFIHKDPSEVTATYRCDQCSFETKRKICLKRHQLTHQSASDVTLYECEQCSFQTKHKGSLISHLQIHKDASETTMFQCELCSFQSRHKRNLKKHSLIHKNPRKSQ